jgi:hypothetical protein
MSGGISLRSEVSAEVANSSVSIDQVWSALRFRPLKEGEAQFIGGRS